MAASQLLNPLERGWGGSRAPEQGFKEAEAARTLPSPSQAGFGITFTPKLPQDQQGQTRRIILLLKRPPEWSVEPGLCAGTTEL